LVEKAVRIVELMGARIQTSTDTRRTLKLG